MRPEGPLKGERLSSENYRVQESRPKTASKS
jgi:hypothetical protein